jgi:hypothetical protein
MKYVVIFSFSALVLMSIISAIFYTTNKSDGRIQGYFTNLKDSVSNKSRTSQGVVDSSVPFYILDNVFDHYSRTSIISKLVDKNIALKIDLSLPRAMMIGRDGMWVLAEKYFFLKIESNSCINQRHFKIESYDVKSVGPIYLRYRFQGVGTGYLKLYPSAKTIKLMSQVEGGALDLGPIYISDINIEVPVDSCLKEFELFSFREIHHD